MICQTLSQSRSFLDVMPYFSSVTRTEPYGLNHLEGALGRWADNTPHTSRHSDKCTAIKLWADCWCHFTARLQKVKYETKLASKYFKSIHSFIFMQFSRGFFCCCTFLKQDIQCGDLLPFLILTMGIEQTLLAPLFCLCSLQHSMRAASAQPSMKRRSLYTTV